MPRIGRQIAHDEHVDLDCIRACFSTDRGRSFRYSLHIRFRCDRQRDQLVAVVLKNPSSADEARADNTIRRVETYVFKRFPRAREIAVLNLFALRATDASDLAAHIADHGIRSATGDRNDAIIADDLNRSHHILLAWGATSGISKPRYEERIHAVVQMLRPHADRIRTVDHVPTSGYPRHGLRWSYSHPAHPVTDLTDLAARSPAEHREIAAWEGDR